MSCLSLSWEGYGLDFNLWRFLEAEIQMIFRDAGPDNSPLALSHRTVTLSNQRCVYHIFDKCGASSVANFGRLERRISGSTDTILESILESIYETPRTDQAEVSGNFVYTEVVGGIPVEGGSITTPDARNTREYASARRLPR